MITTYAQAVLGFRRWRVTDNNELRSWGKGQTLWRVGTNVAYCPSGQHHAPATDCQCGLYAYHDIAEVWSQASATRTIIGAIAARGQTEVHYQGWRAEEVVILALAPMADATSGRAETIAQDYGVPLVPLQQLAAFAEQYAQPVPMPDRPPHVIWQIRQHLQTLVKQIEHVPSLTEYVAARQELPQLPSVTSIYRSCGSWGAALDMADFQAEPGRLEDTLLAGLVRIAAVIGWDRLTRSGYRRFIAEHPEQQWYTDGIITTWFGSWERALEQAQVRPLQS